MIMFALSNEQLLKAAPSIFAATPWKDVSERYTFIPTIQIVESLRKEGFFPVRAQQSSSRIESKGEFTKHMIRFQRIQDMVDHQAVNPGHHFYNKHNEQEPEVPEIILVNSHDRSSGYQLEAGLFRLVCSNGLTVKSSDLGSISVRHSGNVTDQVIDGCCRLIEEMPQVLGHVDRMKHIRLDRQEQEIFAAAAVQLRYPNAEDGTKTAPIEPDSLLRIRRAVDKASDLWTTFNTIQENFIKGGVAGRGTTGKRMHTRAVKSVNEDLRLNKALWLLAEQMAVLKG
jgi:hypothetical protein